MVNSSVADVPAEEAITGIYRCFPQSTNIERVKRRFMENIDFVEPVRWLYTYLSNGHFRDDDDKRTQGSVAPAITSQLDKNIENKWKFRWHIVWKLLVVHSWAIYGIYCVLTTGKFATLLWGYLFGQITLIGSTAGAHRLWSHRAFKATWQLRLLLMVMHTASGYNHIYDWVRDHRVHHKYTDTDADPYSAHRGFFFAHIGWLLIQKHPDVINKGIQVDMSDIEKDSIVMFQKKYFVIIMPLVCIVFPAIVPWFFWNENLWTSFFIAAVRGVYFLHTILMINSFAHFFGYRPYNKDISAVQNKTVSYLTQGEGWHNYHHVFPWDYKAAELSAYEANMSATFIYWMANIGWAYDLKTVPPHLVAKRALRTGDGSYVDQGSGIRTDEAEDDEHCQILFRKKK